MLKTKNQKLTVVIFLILVCCFLIYIYSKSNQVEKESPVELKLDSLVTSQSVEKVSKSATLEINSESYKSKITEEISIYDFMKEIQNKGLISFQEKNYPGMGKFIESINEIKNDNKNWIYYVNGQKANIGISNYKIKPGDVVSWKYEDSY